MLSLLFIVGACNPKNTQEIVDVQDDTATEKPEPTKYESMATDICGCTESLINALVTLEAETDPVKKEELVKEVQEQRSKTIPCLQGLKEKYGDVMDDQKDEARAALKEHCPAYYNMMTVQMIK